MKHKKTFEITNDRLNEAIAEYAKDRTPQRMAAVLHLLRNTRLFVPAGLVAPDKPLPYFLKNKKGDAYLAVYTTKSLIPADPNTKGVLCMPFQDCNELVMNEKLDLKGLVINPFSENLVLMKELIKKLHEEDKKMEEIRQIKMTPEQFDRYAREQIEFILLPHRLYREGEAFVNRLCDEKEELINEVFAKTYKDPKLYRGSKWDFAVMALDIAEDMTLIRIDMPEKGMVPPLCYRIYVTYNPLTKKIGYYTIEMCEKRKVKILGAVDKNGKHLNYGFAPVESGEMERVMEIERNGETPVMTS